jgi:hypothetical protein
MSEKVIKKMLTLAVCYGINTGRTYEKTISTGVDPKHMKSMIDDDAVSFIVNGLYANN